MPNLEVAPYGSWRSPITSDLIVSEAVDLGQIELEGQDVYWAEARPIEGGRNVILRRTPDSQITEITPPPFNARTRVHEYGGGAFAIADGTVYFSNFADSRLYRQTPGEAPQPITPEGDLRYADLVVDWRRRRLIAVREDHSHAGQEATNTLVDLDLAGARPTRVLVSGNDFYSSPRLNPDGSRLAWLTWNHPNLPWDGTELWVGEVQPDGTVGPAALVAGGPSESIFQPEWSPDGVLYFVSDRTGWWNLYRWKAGATEPLAPMEAEFGRPQWVFGLSTYAIISSEQLVCTVGQEGTWRVATLDPASGRLQPIDVPYTEVADPRASGEKVVFRAGSPTELTALVQLDLATQQLTVLRRSSEAAIDPGYLSVPQPISFSTTNGLAAHALYYPPQNRDFTAPPGEKTPLLVKSHGGPTSAASSTLNLRIQYWTSRGFAVLDVNYGGSTGYGRPYRQRLEGQWGVVDVDDCLNGARYLVAQGLVDENRLAIDGGSAGGYTTLCALTFHDLFKAGASHFGLAELESFVKETHKFESRYLDRLIGPYPERADLYRERSPLNYADRISCPVILFQGLDDKIVPPHQAEIMVKALRGKGLPFAYVAFPGEGHGFRRAENIRRSLDGELYFYSRIFGFALADPIEPVPIENL